jgi:hypothetical protein
MLTVQHTKHFAHPANWAGFMLVGADVRLSNKVALMGQALCELLKNPEKCRDALRVTLHLVSRHSSVALSHHTQSVPLPAVSTFRFYTFVLISN